MLSLIFSLCKNTPFLPNIINQNENSPDTPQPLPLGPFKNNRFLSPPPEKPDNLNAREIPPILVPPSNRFFGGSSSVAQSHSHYLLAFSSRTSRYLLNQQTRSGQAFPKIEVGGSEPWGQASSQEGFALPSVSSVHLGGSEFCDSGGGGNWVRTESFLVIY